MAVTVRQIAEVCGVSLPTVSLILNDRGDRYSLQTRERVRETAQRLGYIPNGSARALARRTKLGIGLITSTDSGHSVVSKIVPGIQRALRERDLHLTLAELPDQKLTDAGFVPKILREFSVSGFLVGYTHDIPPLMLELMERHNIPSVWLNTKRPVDCVYPDDVGGAALCTEHLLRLGHRRIAYLTSSYGNTHYSVADREAGYRGAMERAGLVPRLLPRVSWPRPRGYREAIRGWLRDAERPTAVVTYGSVEATSILHEAEVLGLSVPRDLSITTLHDEPPFVSDMTIDTATLPFARVGQLAVEMLCERMESPEESLPGRAVLPALELFDTSAPPR